MAEFSKFNGFDVKDKTSREGIRALQEALENLPIDDIDNEIKQLKEEIENTQADLDTAESLLKELKNTEIDNSSITLNDLGQIQTIGVIDQNTNAVNKYWTGTKAEYDSIAEKDENTFYHITDDTVDYITNSVDNLINYYLKSETYNKEEINALISSVNSFSVLVVDTLPTENIDTHTIYLLPKENETNDNYDEYIYINNSWEHIGSTSVDLTEYYKKSEIDTLLLNKANVTDLSTVATTGNYNDLNNKPTIYTKVSQLENDSGYLTEHQSLAAYSTTEEMNKAIGDAIASIINGNEVSY